MNSSHSITNPKAQAFFKQFKANRRVNRDFYQLVPEEKLDFRMVDTKDKKSDSIRESIVHQIDTTRDYINGVKSGKLQFDISYPDLEDASLLTKEGLIQKLQETEDELTKILSVPDIENKKVVVPWSTEPVEAIDSLWGIDSHEILHQGWNLAEMDHLQISRFPSFIEMWGD